MDPDEIVSIDLFSQSKLFQNKLIGSYGIVLQGVVKDGRIHVTDSLTDPNNKPLPVSFC